MLDEIDKFGMVDACAGVMSFKTNPSELCDVVKTLTVLSTAKSKIEALITVFQCKGFSFL